MAERHLLAVPVEQALTQILELHLSFTVAQAEQVVAAAVVADLVAEPVVRFISLEIL